jgi:hypothetical protein
MASTHEAKVKKQVRKILETHDVYARQPLTGGYGHNGQLDFYACRRPDGKYLGIETKSIHSTHGVTALQQAEIDAIRDCGGIALVINETNYHELERVLNEHTN